MGLKKRKIVIIRGLITAGKTTTSYELAKVLPGWIFIDAWKIKEMFEPLNLRGDERKSMIKISKKTIKNIVKEVMNNFRFNIIVQESSQSFIKKYLRKELKKYNYKIYSFFLDIDVKSAEKRDIQREKPTMGINKKNLSHGEWLKYRVVNPEKEDMVIHTRMKSVKQILKMILKEIDEKPKKHPYAHTIRKSW